MSLLMDALKKAEKDKKKAADETKPQGSFPATAVPNDSGLTTVALVAGAIAPAKPPVFDGLGRAPLDVEPAPAGSGTGTAPDAEARGADLEGTRFGAGGETGTIGLWGRAMEAQEGPATPKIGPSLDRTLPSQRELNASLKDYFESSQPLGSSAAHEPSGPRAFRIGDTVSRVSADTVFSASRRVSSARNVGLGLGVVLVLGVSLAGLWVWSELDSGASRGLSPAPLPPPGIAARDAHPAAGGGSAPLPPQPAPAVPAPPAAVAEPPVEDLALAPELEAGATPAERDPEPAPVVEDRSPADPDDPASRMTGMSPAPATPVYTPPIHTTKAPRPSYEPSAIRIRKSRPRERLDPTLSEAYRAFQSGNLDRAQTLYRAIEAREPERRDALLGLAAVAVRRGRPAEAYRYYRRLTELDPRDSVARAGIASLTGSSGQAESESRLKLLLDQSAGDQSPADQSQRAGYLHFALGNLYARQGRWPDAQAAYFKAFTSDSANPDYLFNLAVSLDQMGQGKAALGYYRRALGTGARRTRGFQTADALARIRALSSAKP